MNVVVIVAPRGIGLELVRQCRASIAGIRRVTAGLDPSANGRFFEHDGRAIEW